MYSDVTRTVNGAIWNANCDPFRKMTPNEKLFYLYLQTSPYSNPLGCYVLPMDMAGKQTGFSVEEICGLLRRLEYDHNLVRYDRSTGEVLVRDWKERGFYTSMQKLVKSIEDEQSIQNTITKAVSEIKNLDFRQYVHAVIDSGSKADMLLLPDHQN